MERKRGDMLKERRHDPDSAERCKGERLTKGRELTIE